MSAVVTLLFKYRKLIGVAIGAVAVVYAVWDYGNDRYDAGAAHVQKQWAEAAEATRIAAEAQRLETQAREREARARNNEVVHGYQEQVSRISADRDSIARRLRDNEVRLRALSNAANQPGTADAATQPGSSRSADEALDDYDRACRADAAQLEALIRQVKGQLDSHSDAS